MDGITGAQDVLNRIQNGQGELGEDLATVERLIKAKCDQMGREALQAHLDRHARLG